eukprot:1243027-Prymnesium_polylepis.2
MLPSQTRQSVAEEEGALRSTLSEFGVGAGREWPGPGAAWPSEVGFRLYCSLLEATFEADEPAQYADELAE